MPKKQRQPSGPTYTFKSGSRLSGDPGQVGQRLEDLSVKHGGLTAQQIVDDARTKSSPLHSYFEWDTDRAAEQYRLEQARSLIRHVVVVYPEAPDAPPTRAYVVFKHPEESDPPLDKARYLPMARVMSDVTLRRRAVREALEEADTWRKRYNYLNEFATVFSALDKVKTRTRKRRKST